MLAREHTTWSVSDSRYGDRRLTVVRVATTGAHAPHPKAIPRLPAPGEALVSAPLADLIRESGAPLAGRTGARIVGSVPRAYLATPDDLVAIVGLAPSQLPRSPQRNLDTAVVWSFDPPRGWPAPDASVRADATNQRTGLVFVLIPLIGSLLAFTSNTGRFALLSRRRRASSAALVGATPAQARAAIAMESAVGSLTGAVLGVGLTALLIWARPQSSLFGLSAFRSDLSVPLWLPFATIAAVVGLAVCSAVLGVRRASVAPLDTRVDGPRPSWLGRLTVTVLILGLALVPLSVLFLGTGRRTLLVVPLTILATFGAFAALNMVGTGLMLRVAERLRDGRTPAGVISGARLATHYGSANRTFRVAAISLLLGTIAVCGIAAEATSPDPNRADLAVNLDQNTSPGPDIRPFLRRLKSVPGVIASTTIAQVNNLRSDLPGPISFPIETGDCGALARVRRLPISTVCPDGAVVLRSTGLRVGSTIQLAAYVESGTSPVGNPVGVARVVGDGWETHSAVFIPPRLLPTHFRSAPLRIEIATATREQVAERISLALPTGATLRSTGEPTETWSSGAKSVALLSVIVLLGALTGAIATIEGLMERRQMYERLIALGSPRRTLVGAAAIEAAVPCIVATIGAVITGLAIGIPIGANVGTGAGLVFPTRGLIIIGLTALVAIGLSVGVAALAAWRFTGRAELRSTTLPSAV